MNDEERVTAFRAMVQTRGWEALCEIFRARVAQIAAECIHTDEVNNLTRGEARALLKMMHEPVATVEEFDAMQREKAADARWAEEVIASGFRTAGLPGYREEVANARSEPE